MPTPIDLDTWDPISFECVVCSDQAVSNPKRPEEWGCRKCQGTTFSVFLNFRAVAPWTEIPFASTLRRYSDADPLVPIKP